jgi:hypothetical protein
VCAASTLVSETFQIFFNGVDFFFVMFATRKGADGFVPPVPIRILLSSFNSAMPSLSADCDDNARELPRGEKKKPKRQKKKKTGLHLKHSKHIF